MPRARSSRVLAAPPQEVWRTVGDVEQMPRWWPKARRVEALDGDEFTQVLRTDKGRDVRADFRIVDVVPFQLLSYEQLLEGTPFASLLRSSAVEIALAPAGEEATALTITAERSLRGLARFGSLIMRRGTRRQLDEALDGLVAIYGTAEVRGG